MNNIWEERGKSPLWWMHKGNDLLKVSSNENKQKKPNSDVCYMLLGMSIECFLKGIFAAKNQDIEHTHKLKKLANALNIDLTSREKDILEYLTECVFWLGRYPNPKKNEFPSELYYRIFMEKKRQGSMCVFQPNKLDNFNDMVNIALRIRSYLIDAYRETQLPMY